MKSGHKDYIYESNYIFSGLDLAPINAGSAKEILSSGLFHHTKAPFLFVIVTYYPPKTPINIDTCGSKLDPLCGHCPQPDMGSLSEGFQVYCGR